MTRLTGLALTFSLMLSPAAAQTQRLSIETIYGGELSTPAPSQTRWTPDGNLSYFLSGDDGRDLWVFNTDTFETSILVGGTKLREIAPLALPGHHR